jgi:hypothetical protein
MKLIDETMMGRSAPSPWGGAMAKRRRSAAIDMELKVLQLAATAADLRRRLTARDLARIPRLAAVLDACDALFEELGWGDPLAPPEPGDAFDQ